MEVVAESPTDLVASGTVSPDPPESQPEIERKGERMSSLIEWAAKTDNAELEEYSNSFEETENNSLEVSGD